MAVSTLVMTSPGVAVAAASPPRPDHVVIVVLENKRYDAVIGDSRTPWVTSLAATSANLTNFYAETHPSQPNYLALFSGSTQGVTDNKCPHNLGNRINLGRQLLDAGHTFAGYSEDLPRTGWQGCGSQGYVRRHNPWVNFANVPATANRPYTDFPSDYRRLPTLSFVIPNLCHDMHDCPKAQADAWLRREFAGYVAWAKRNNSLFILTFDEDNRTGGNHIATVVAGAGVRAGAYRTRLDHYDLLRTLQKMYGLPLTGASRWPDMWTR
ncbi:alkaline phosphatase family protein [Actinoplanes bogorensis]|uniref:Alkaline phosphatase family protein n=2 Tax=Paractinoplanes bogorensis TaxID=1610840 RepID=A0ABS5YX23_9ACTN|nr:alkaline phosphatase family protein [Actinoplanes bogorensis]